MAASADENDDGITGINITPLVDVFLVLLILVMISSSLLESREIPVSIPKAATAATQAPKASGLTMDIDKRIYLDGLPADSAIVAIALRKRVAIDSMHQVLVAADERLAYSEIVRLLDWVRSANIRKYALKVSTP